MKKKEVWYGYLCEDEKLGMSIGAPSSILFSTPKAAQREIDHLRQPSGFMRIDAWPDRMVKVTIEVMPKKARKR